MTLKNNRAPLLCYFKLCAFRSHMWIQTGVTVRKRLNSFLTSVTLIFDLWPWPFARTSLLSMVITPKYDERNIVKKVWQTDRQTGRRTDWRTEGQKEMLRVAWSQLKIRKKCEYWNSAKPGKYNWCPLKDSWHTKFWGINSNINFRNVKDVYPVYPPPQLHNRVYSDTMWKH